MSSADAPLVRLTVLVYRLLLRCYPPSVRARYGSQMEQLMRDSSREAQRRKGAIGVAGLWRHTMYDLATTAPRERLAAFAEWRRARRLSRVLLPQMTLNPTPTPGESMGALMQDLRFALRTLRRNSGFTLVVVLSLALGIGANTLIYSVVDGVVLRPFPYPEPERLVAVSVTFPKLDGDRRYVEAISPAEFGLIQSQSRTLERFVAFDLGNRNISGGDRPERVFTGFIWGNPFETLGMRPALGRGFRPEETTREGPRVAVISHRTWINRFGGDSAIVGGTMMVNGTPTTVIGVMPPRLLLAGTDLWLPMATDPAQFPRTMRQFTFVARLRPGATLEQANAELGGLAGRIEREFVSEFKEYEGWRLQADTWVNANVEEVKPAATLLLGAVGLVLLIACANIASLMLARAATRTREIAVRRALGAGGARIARQMLTESVLLAIAGAVGGLLIAYALLRPVVAMLPEQAVAAGAEIAINGRVLLFTIGLGMLSGLLFGLAPAMQGARRDHHEALRGEGSKMTMSAGSRRLRHAFVVAEIAFSLMLLVGAGLMIQSLARLQRVDPGFDSSGVLTMRLSLPREKYKKEAVAPFFEELSRRIEAVPGVQAAGAATQFPPMNGFTTRVALDGELSGAAGSVRTADITNASERFFASLGYTLKAGRTFTAQDEATSPRVAVINETAARRFFPNQSPLGKRIRLGGEEQKTQPPLLEIVGVTGDVRNHGLDAATEPEVFVPVRQQEEGWNNQLFLTIRTSVEPMSLLPAIRSAIATLDADQPAYAIQTLEQSFAETMMQRRVSMVLLTVFACVAMALAAVGIYGVMSHMVNERTHEIGIRMALGAERGDVLGLVAKQTLKLVGLGLALGLGGSLAMGRVVSRLVYETRTTDPLTLAGVVTALAAVAMFACYLPARRATRVAPMVALRHE